MDTEKYVDMTMQDWPRAEMQEAIRYLWCLQSYQLTGNGCQESSWVDRNAWRPKWLLDMKYHCSVVCTQCIINLLTIQPLLRWDWLSDVASASHCWSPYPLLPGRGEEVTGQCAWLTAREQTAGYTPGKPGLKGWWGGGEKGGGGKEPGRH